MAWWPGLDKVDQNGDGTVAAAKMGAYGRDEALRGFSRRKEDLVRPVLTFDSDQDGKLTREAVRAARAGPGV